MRADLPVSAGTALQRTQREYGYLSDKQEKSDADSG
jgi:hypothetical protein